MGCNGGCPGGRQEGVCRRCKDKQETKQRRGSRNQGLLELKYRAGLVEVQRVRPDRAGGKQIRQRDSPPKR